MFQIINKIYQVFFFSPNRYAKKQKNIHTHKSSTFLDGAQFRLNPTNKITIGKNSLVGAFFNFESTKGEVIIGENTFIHDGSKLMARTKIEIGNHVMISWDCTIMDHSSHSLNYQERVNDFDKLLLSTQQKRHLLKDKSWEYVNTTPVKIEDHVWIGFGAVIMRGVTIHEGAIIGSQSVVREDVPAWSVVIGNPARVVKKLKPKIPN